MKIDVVWYCTLILVLYAGLASPKLNQNHSTRRSNKDQVYENNVTNSHDGKLMKIKFTSSLVDKEYLVMFDGYYSKSERFIFLRKAMHLMGKNDSQWIALPHQSILEVAPSDFDVIQVDSSFPYKIHGGIPVSHIKSVTIHKKVIRSLKYVDDDSTEVTEEKESIHEFGYRSLLKALSKKASMPEMLSTPRLWAAGYQGQGVKVAVFDTGLSSAHPHFDNIVQRTDWTGEKIAEDGVGHGTFVASIIGGSSQDCPGLAPKAQLYICRVFTNKQVSYTSWFLDAFNYAIQQKIDVLNLSIGGPDFMDQPFVEKVWELSANNIIMVSAIGNDGPLYGTLNNPADQMDVIGVGGIESMNAIARFSSRGMTTWELPAGYGRVKPDVVTYVSMVYGSGLNGECKTLSGTSVAAPVVTGVIALLLSSVEPSQRYKMNPASVKQSLMESADRIPDVNMFEQGHGRVNLIKAYSVVNSYQPQASLVPSYLDLTEFPYMWPYSTQDLYYGGLPVIANVTILNGMGVKGRIKGKPTWHPHNLHHGSYLEVSFAHSHTIWPWSGYLAIYISVASAASRWEGTAQGYIEVVIESEMEKPVVDPSDNTTRIITTLQESTLKLPLKAHVIKTPPREKRILWDQYHNLRYPPGYFPRDDLTVKQDLLDWNGDHIHTNFRGLYNYLRQLGYFIEVLGQPFTCFDADNYGTLLIVDPEEEFFDDEILKLKRDMTEKRLSVIVFAEWYNATVMSKVRFYDENTRRWWIPQTGGSNVPALNDLLGHFGVSLSGHVLKGDFVLGGNSMHYASGTSISQFPKKSLIIRQTLQDEANEIVDEKRSEIKNVPILGLHQLDGLYSGRLAVYGDSNCIDDAHNKKPCFWLIEELLQYTMRSQLPISLRSDPSALVNLDSTAVGTLRWDYGAAPQRMANNELEKYSKVLKSQDGDGQVVMGDMPVCEHLVWAKSFPVNESATRQRLLSLDDANVVLLPDLPYMNDVMGGHQVIEMFKYGTARDRLGTFFRGVLMAGTLLFLYFLRRFVMKRRRRAFTPRIMIRCCFNWFQRIKTNEAASVAAMEYGGEYYPLSTSIR